MSAQTAARIILFLMALLVALLAVAGLCVGR